MTDNNEEFEMPDDDLARLADATAKLQFGDLLNAAMNRNAFPDQAQPEPEAADEPAAGPEATAEPPPQDGPRRPRPDMSQGANTGASGLPHASPAQEFADLMTGNIRR